MAPSAGDVTDGKFGDWFSTLAGSLSLQPLARNVTMTNKKVSTVINLDFMTSPRFVILARSPQGTSIQFTFTVNLPPAYQVRYNSDETVWHQNKPSSCICDHINVLFAKVSIVFHPVVGHILQYVEYKAL